MSLLGFGEKVAGYDIPVLNEREIRAAAGMLFVLMLVAVMLVGFKWQFTLLKYATTFFLMDILTRVLISPRFAPSLILGRWIVSRQTPEYVGARQKQFAWYIGVALASAMFIQLVLLNVHSPINGIICMICLVFLFFEAVFGICLGCLVYPWFFKDKVQYCAGEICDPKAKQPIQKISLGQLLVALALVGALIGAGYALRQAYSQAPALILGMEKPPAQ
jgi:hypothetical protein